MSSQNSPGEPSSSQTAVRGSNRGRRRSRGSRGNRGPQNASQQRQASQNAASSIALAPQPEETARLPELIARYDERSEEIDRLIFQMEEYSMNATGTAASSEKAEKLASEFRENECWLYMWNMDLKDLQQQCEREGYDPVHRKKLDLRRGNGKRPERNVYSGTQYLKDMPPQYPAFLKKIEAANFNGSRGILYSKYTPRQSLYADYKKQDPEFFKLGRVFQMLWPETVGSSGKTDLSNRSFVPASFNGEYVFCETARFIVIRDAGKHCFGLRINTYGGRGVSKSYIEKAHHGIVYIGPEIPPPLPTEKPLVEKGEQPMQPIAIRIEPDMPGEKLISTSRINYGKVYTLEYNVKARPTGQVHPDSLLPLLSQYKDVRASIDKNTADKAKLLGEADDQEFEQMLQALQRMCGASESQARDVLSGKFFQSTAANT